MTEQATKSPRKRTITSRAKRRARKPKHVAIAERAYYIHLEEGGNELSNWLRAERELTAA